MIELIAKKHGMTVEQVHEIERSFYDGPLSTMIFDEFLATYPLGGVHREVAHMILQQAGK